VSEMDEFTLDDARKRSEARRERDAAVDLEALRDRLRTAYVKSKSVRLDDGTARLLAQILDRALRYDDQRHAVPDEAAAARYILTGEYRMPGRADE
jgi:hypothetical protein